MVDQVVDLFHTTYKVKTQEVVKSRGHHCGVVCFHSDDLVHGGTGSDARGDIELAGYLPNETGPVALVLDLRITHDRVGSSTDPTLNGHLRYPNNLVSWCKGHDMVRWPDGFRMGSEY